MRPSSGSRGTTGALRAAGEGRDRAPSPGSHVLPVVLAMLLVALACQDPTETSIAGEALTEISADQIIYEMETFLTKEGVRTGQLRADSAHLFNDSASVHLFGVNMILFNDQGGERARVVADSGRLDERTERMVAWSDVVATIPEGNRRIESDELYYDPNANRIWSETPTTFREGTRVTRGSCFESDLQFQNRRVCSIRGSADIGTSPRPDTTGGGGRDP